MARILPLQTLLLASTFCLIPAIGNASQYVQVFNEDGMISVKANNVTARTVVEELSNQLDINFIVTGDADTRLNLDIVEEPLDKALPKLSPNNLIVRETSDSDSQIIEVVLMLGDSSAAGYTASEEKFLPTGSPAANIEPQGQPNQNQTGSDQGKLTSPVQALRIRQAADNAAYDSNLPPAQVPPMFANEQRQEQIDQSTGVANAQ